MWQKLRNAPPSGSPRRCKNHRVTQTAVQQESSLRRLILGIGVLMIAAGLAIMAWFAWQYWGTNVVAQQKQQEILDDWTNSEAIGILRVPRFGADYEVPIIPGGDLVEPKGRAALAKGVEQSPLDQLRNSPAAKSRP